MIIYFHIDELNRDAITASILKKKLKERGHYLIYGNRITMRLLNYFHNFIDVIIMPRPHFLYDNFKEKWLFWDSKFITISTESLGIITTEKELMAKTLLEREYFEDNKQYVNRIDAFCVWGKRQLIAIEEFAAEVRDKFYFVGHPRYDNQCLKNSHFNSKKKKISKIQIGIISRSNALNDYYKRTTLESFSEYLSEKINYEYNNKKSGKMLLFKRPKPIEGTVCQSIDTVNIINIIKSLIDLDYEINFRAHPKENLDVWQKMFGQYNLKIKFSKPEQPISYWLENLDYLIGPPSTAFYDAVINNVTPISIDQIDPRRKFFVTDFSEDNNSLMPHIFRPKNIEEIKEFIIQNKKINITDKIKNIFSEEVGYPECQDSINNLIDVCEKISKSKNIIKKRLYFYYFYLFFQFFYGFLWDLKSFIIRRKSNSAMYSLNFKIIRYINNL
jgi:hypothetical protein